MTIVDRFSKATGILLLLLGPVLVISIALATTKLLVTYEQINIQKQSLIWNIFQLDKEMGDTLFDAQQYINGYLEAKPLRMSYELLWSRFPVSINSMQKDDHFRQISGLTTLYNEVFSHVKSAELIVLESEKINKVELHLWVNKLNEMNKEINRLLLENIASSRSEYSYKTASKVINTAVILSVLIIIFILYLGNLLITLRKERSRNLHMLAHDTLTGLHSRDFVMRSIWSLCENKKPFTLLAFDLNKFKAVNDTFGHHAGDQLLIHLADKFQETLCKFGIVGRIGGDEFLWIVESDDTQVIEEQYALFLKELKNPCIVNDKRLILHISTGGGIAADDDFHPTQLLERVDEAMYQAKSLQIKEIFWGNVKIPNASAEELQKTPVTSIRRTPSIELAADS